ncbi:hypothetical protein B0H11DRAFT_2234754 [Mycena galericulata]|nr:hypothetical protein B0H11DRAFT_2234754 [Mycena galericulata]
MNSPTVSYPNAEGGERAGDARLSRCPPRRLGPERQTCRSGSRRVGPRTAQREVRGSGTPDALIALCVAWGQRGRRAALVLGAWAHKPAQREVEASGTPDALIALCVAWGADCSVILLVVGGGYITWRTKLDADDVAGYDGWIWVASETRWVFS